MEGEDLDGDRSGRRGGEEECLVHEEEDVIETFGQADKFIS